ncbi:MAG: ShlB/FhaC/HecB family hemolysin secretion/activation protein [Magnetococcales bacterium]|nr:ShlB/FhaC/HecB family hemolysin secretion/activation protein [Magnetococcales bacterium]
MRADAFVFLLGCLVLLFANDVLAQAAIDPGRVQKQFEVPVVPHAAPEIVIPEIPKTIAPAEAANVKVTLTQIIIDGATVYPEDSLQGMTNSLIGHEITLTEIFTLADAITSRYRNDDYILSRAVVPAQKLENGVLHIQVIEGFIDKVIFDGQSTVLLEQYGNHISKDRPLRGSVLERYLLLMNDLPGRTVRAVMEPSKDSVGGSDLTLVVKQKSIDAYAGIDNRGTRYIGPVQASAGVSVNNMLRHDDKTSINYATVSHTRELRYVNVKEEIPLGNDGFLLAVNAGQSFSRPGFLLEQLNAKTAGAMFGAKLSYPVNRSRADTLKVSAAFDYLNSETTLNNEPDIPPSSTDRIRALRVGLIYDWADSFYGHNILESYVSQGLGILNASDNLSATLSRPGGRVDFKKWTMDVSRRQELDRWISNLGLYLAASAQSSLGNTLLSSEQFGAGGATYGRGYDPSEITGDSGISSKAEVQYSSNSNGFVRAWQIYGFYDFAHVRNRQPDNLEKYSYSLASLGGGARFDMLDALSGDFTVAQPLTRDITAEKLDGNDGKPLRLQLSLTARY